jgi:hypothetical protein
MTSTAISRVWPCSACKTLNKQTYVKCYSCGKPRLNGNWPQATWFQERLKLVRVREAKSE